MDHALLALMILSSSPILVPPKTHADPTPHFIVEFFDQGGRRIYDPKKVAAGPQEDFCPRYKCLMVANRSRFRVTGLYLTTEVAPTTAAVWEAPLSNDRHGVPPRQARWWYRNEARRDVCEITVRVRAVDEITGERVDNSKAYNFCTGDPVVVVLLSDPPGTAPEGKATVEPGAVAGAR